MVTAVARALHRAEPPPWVLDDCLALGFVGADGPDLRERLLNGMQQEDLLSRSAGSSAFGRVSPRTWSRERSLGVRVGA
jgi:hypothetical protein